MAGILQAFNECMVLATKAGIDPKVMLDVVLSSRAEWHHRDEVPRIMERDFTPFFPLQLMAKDVRLIVESASSLGLNLPLATALSGIYENCLAEGLGTEDFAAAIKLLEKQAELEVRPAGDQRS